MKKLTTALLLLLLLTGCTAQEKPPETQPREVISETLPAPAVAEEVAAIVEEVPPPTGVVLEPEMPGQQEARCDEAVVDYSRTQDGYVTVRYFGQTDKRLKVLLNGPATTYQYDLPQDSWTVLPLSDGDGLYQLGIYRNVQESEYALVMMAEFSVTLRDEFAPFLRPNQYVNYLTAPNTVAMGARLCDGLEGALPKVAAVYDYVVQNLTYDEEKAATVESGYLPNLDEILEIQKGICFDYAAMMTAMLRSQEVPCKLVVGYAGSIYHAWISIWTEENGWVDRAIFFDGHAWKRMDPTFVSSAQNRQEILDFVEHGDYTVMYLY